MLNIDKYVVPDCKKEQIAIILNSYKNVLIICFLSTIDSQLRLENIKYIAIKKSAKISYKVVNLDWII